MNEEMEINISADTGLSWRQRKHQKAWLTPAGRLRFVSSSWAMTTIGNLAAMSARRGCYPAPFPGDLSSVDRKDITLHGAVKWREVGWRKDRVYMMERMRPLDHYRHSIESFSRMIDLSDASVIVSIQVDISQAIRDPDEYPDPLDATIRRLIEVQFKDLVVGGELLRAERILNHGGPEPGVSNLTVSVDCSKWLPIFHNEDLVMEYGGGRRVDESND